jgi:hypothetical protein
MLPEFLRGLDDAYFFLLSGAGQMPVRLVAMDFATRDTSYRCRVIEIFSPEIRGLTKAEEALHRGVQFDDIEFRNDKAILSKDSDDPKAAVEVSFSLNTAASGRYSNCYLPGLDDVGSIGRALQVLTENNQLSWRYFGGTRLG